MTEDNDDPIGPQRKGILQSWKGRLALLAAILFWVGTWLYVFWRAHGWNM